MRLPATLVEAEAELAKQRVRQWLEQCRAEDWMDWMGIVGISATDPKAGHILVRQMLKQLAMSPVDPFIIDEIIASARAGSEDCDIAMRELIRELDNRRQDLPTALAAYRDELINPYHQQYPRTRGAQKATNILLDIVIVVFVERAIAQFPRLAVFSRSARRSCICAIVAAVFNEAKLGRFLTAESVRKLWNRLGDNPIYYKHLLLAKLGP